MCSYKVETEEKSVLVTKIKGSKPDDVLHAAAEFIRIEVKPRFGAVLSQNMAWIDPQEGENPGFWQYLIIWSLL